MILWIPALAVLALASFVLFPFLFMDTVRRARLASIEASILYLQHFAPEREIPDRLTIRQLNYEEEVSIRRGLQTGARLHGMRQLANADPENLQDVLRKCHRLFYLLAEKKVRTGMVGDSPIPAWRILRAYIRETEGGHDLLGDEESILALCKQREVDARQLVEFVIAGVRACKLDDE